MRRTYDDEVESNELAISRVAGGGGGGGLTERDKDWSSMRRADCLIELRRFRRIRSIELEEPVV